MISNPRTWLEDVEVWCRYSSEEGMLAAWLAHVHQVDPDAFYLYQVPPLPLLILYGSCLTTAAAAAAAAASV